jgi:hypothetical protein
MFFNDFNVLILKIKNNKNYFDIFFLKIFLENILYYNAKHITSQ